MGCLIYLHEHGCEWNADCCRIAVEGGHLECLRYLHEHGCEWNTDSCEVAAREGHLDCLRYLHEHGCEWDADSSAFAADMYEFSCLCYLIEEGCDFDPIGCLHKVVADMPHARQKSFAEHLATINCILEHSNLDDEDLCKEFNDAFRRYMNFK